MKYNPETPMTPNATLSYDINDREFIRAKELDRLEAQCALFWPQEARALRGLGIRNDARILEVGSGPGFVTERLLTEFASCEVVAVELDASLAADAQAHLSRFPASRHRQVVGSIYDIDLPRDQMDFAYARLVFQHLSDPVSAAARVFELLRPGGRMAILDIDVDLLGIVDPMPPEFMQLLAKREAYMVSRGTNRKVGRQLWSILSRAGFVQLDLALVVAHSDAIGIKAFEREFDIAALTPLIAMGVISAEELRAADAALKDFLNRSPYILAPLVMVSGSKPAINRSGTSA